MTFDRLKESLHVLHRRYPEGDSFTVLGVLWDLQLKMEAECESVGSRANWKLTTLLRLRRFYSLADLVTLYRTHVLPVLEFPTPAIYHATNTALKLVDQVQKRFLREVGFTAVDALLKFGLAPLQTRRDFACLGLVHRAVLGKGPPHFRKWFFPSTKREHGFSTRLQENLQNKQLHDYLDGTHNELLRRSLLGLPRVYNGLPKSVVEAPSVKAFQSRLQRGVCELAERGVDGWENSLNLRKVSFAA